MRDNLPDQQMCMTLDRYAAGFRLGSAGAASDDGNQCGRDPRGNR